MTAIISFLLVLFISLLVVRIAGVALTETGMPREAARFEARSAWSGTGFTTTQSEQIVRNPVRRKIVSFLIVVRNAGVVGAASTLFLSITNIQEGGEAMFDVLLLLGGLLALWYVSGSRIADRYMTAGIRYLLTRLDALDSHGGMALLTLGGDYIVQEVHVFAGSWMQNKSIEEMALDDEGVLVLGIDRKNEDFIGAPSAKTRIQAGDNLILYASGHRLKNLGERKDTPSGTRERHSAVRSEQEKDSKQEEQEAQVNKEQEQNTTGKQ